MRKLLSNSSYSINIYALPMFLTATSIILLESLYCYRKSVVTKAFFFSTLSAGIWQLGTYLIYLMKDHALVVWFYKVFVFLGIAAITPSIYMLTVSVLGLFESKKIYCVKLCDRFVLLLIRLINRQPDNRCQRTILGSLYHIRNFIGTLFDILFLF